MSSDFKEDTNMLSLILTLSLVPVKPAAEVAQFKPCVWPNPCSSKPAVVQIKPCVWPNVCAAPAVAQVEACVWPKKCGKTA